MKNPVRFTWTDVFPEELSVVKKRHCGSVPVEENLVGIAFSGGGIRSATFGLGVLEGLKHFGLLEKIDYLSTVSGGGYIGAWLSANCKRVADRREAVNGYEREVDWLDPTANWKESIDHLRRYSNYLSPIVGFFSADTWSMATIWLRNTVLVQLTVILGIAVLLLVPRPLFVAFENWPQVGDWRWTTICLFILGVVGIAANQLRLNRGDNVPLLKGRSWPTGLTGAAICLAIARAIGVYYDFRPFAAGPIDYRAAAPIAGLLVLAGFWLLPAAVKLLNRFWPGKNPPEQVNYTQAWVQAVVVIPMMAVGFLVGAILWGQSQPNSGELARLDTFGGFFQAAWRHWPFPLSVVFISLWLLSFCSIRSWRDPKGVLAAIMAPLPAMLVLHVLLSAIMLLLHQWVMKDVVMKDVEGKWLAYVWTPSMVLYAFGLTIVMLIGILGRQSSEGVREWWSRFGAWLGIYGFAWMVINLAASYGPQWSAILLHANTWKGVTIGSGWVGTIIAGLFAGKSGSTSGTSGKGAGAKAMELLAAVAPFIFIAGLLVGVSTLLHLVIAINSDLPCCGVVQLQKDHWKLLTDASLGVTMAVLALCFAGLLLLAARVDINEFSLNAFYRSRLVRCYLGATRFRAGERNPQNFTGFDDNDDLPLAVLTEPEGPSAGPLHIVNCALNLGGSSDLALHTRHSTIFTLTPLCCGSRYLSRDQAGNKEEMGYATTAIFGGRDGQPSLGQAISVSGAAASPNMGYHTSTVVAFLMTLFNVRLAWWFPNPSMSGINSPSPWFSLRYLLMELFGGADDKSKYLAISDGGHFENLAAYELVKRKCRVILISDGECDPNLQFEGLGMLIRMCAVDFGAKITIDVGSIRRVGESPWSSNRCAVGRIEYCDGSPDGTLIYLKASMTGHEDTSILQYRATHAAFPHESTGNQFYREDQFESYRSLGRDIVMRAFEPVADEQDFVALAHKLEKVCSPTLHNAVQFTQHSMRLMDLWSQLSANPDLHLLDRELAGSWPDHPNEAFRSAFYKCSEMIQLMENVYLDLGLEETWDHPDNAGWRTMFENWANSSMIRKTWELTAGMYGLRFRYFCNRRLHMPISE
jgi:hypothetical protein